MTWLDFHQDLRTRSVRNSGRTTEKASNEKTTVYRTNTSKQKKTSEEKQAKKKELDRVTLLEGALKASWTAPE